MSSYEKHVNLRMSPVDYVWYEELARTRKETVSDTIRSALTAYRALMQLPLVVSVRPLSELRGELVEAYQREKPIADVTDDGKPKRKRRGREAPLKGT